MHAEVRETRWLTPTLVRVVLGGGDLDRFDMVEATDAYVNLAFAPAGAPYGPLFDPAEVRAEHERTWWPARRRYTVRSWDADARELTIDFVVHGDDGGVAGAWAAGAEPGSVLVLEGPAGGYRPDREADWLLMVGDESALPAVAAALEDVPEGTLVVVRVLCDGPEHETELSCRGDLDLRWVHRGQTHDEEQLADAVRDLAFPRGRVHAFVHGEATEIRAIRRHLLADRGLNRQDMSCSPYWRRDMTDEAWREVKREFVRAMDADVEDTDATTPAR